MSEWLGGGLALEQWTNDLEMIIETAKPAGPVTLLGISQGTAACIGYALRHPDRVERLILYGGYARGAFRRDRPESETAYRAMVDLARVAWGSENLMASGIAGADFVELDSRNHILLEHEPAWLRLRESVLNVLRSKETAVESPLPALSVREREVLAPMADGLSNADIAERLQISDKTVRNHASHVFDKLGVWSRAQAIVFARDHGFGG